MEVNMTKEKKLRFTLNRHNIEHRRYLEKAYQEGFQKGLRDKELSEFTQQTAQKNYNERAI